MINVCTFEFNMLKYLPAFHRYFQGEKVIDYHQVVLVC